MRGAGLARAVVCTVACLAVAIAAAGGQAPTRGTKSVQAPPATAVADAVPLHYQLTVTPDFATASFDGDVVIDFRIARTTSRITLDAVDLDIRAADIALSYGRTATPTVSADPAAGKVSFTVATRLYPGTIKLHIRYSGKLRSDGRGFYLAHSGGRKYLVSQMEATDARRAFPCVDDPAVKASFALSAVVDQDMTGISNGRLVSDRPSETPGKHVLRFGTTPRMSTYLVALAIGELACAEDSKDPVPVRVCAAPENLSRTAFALEAARRALQFDSQYFTFKYPFQKLDLLAVPGGFPGAMENSGAIFFDDAWLVEADGPPEMLRHVALTLSHEVAHQWLGDVVTMRWWNDLWLNEGMATWLAPKAVAAWQPAWHVESEALNEARKAMRLDAFPSTRAVRAPVESEAEIEESFDAMAYEKAGAVLRMVESWIGPEAMRNAVNAYVKAHAYQNATAEDFWKYAAAQGEKADQVLRAFLSQPGIPLVTVDSACDGSETVVTASVRRYSLDSRGAPVPSTPRASFVAQRATAPGATTVPAPGPASPWPVPLQLRGVNATAPMLVASTRVLTEPTQVFRIGGCFPAVLADSGGLGYFHSLYQPQALAQLTSVAASRLTPTERIRLLDDQWALAMSGTTGIGGYLSLATALAADSTPDVQESLAGGLRDLAAHVVDEAARAGFEGWVRKTWGPVLATLGSQSAPDENADRKRLRAAVLEILGRAGRDADVLALARTLVAADASGGQRLDRETRSAMRRLAAVTADAEMTERLGRQDPQETMTATGDPDFATKTIGAALENSQARDGAPALIAAALENAAVNKSVWNLLKARWTDLQPALASPFALSLLVAASGSFCDAESRDDVARFFADKTAAIPRTLQLALERIDACRDFRLRQAPALAEWLSKAGS